MNFYFSLFLSKTKTLNFRPTAHDHLLTCSNFHKILGSTGNRPTVKRIEI